jgi:hypothetical protein
MNFMLRIYQTQKTVLNFAVLTRRKPVFAEALISDTEARKFETETGRAVEVIKTGGRNRLTKCYLKMFGIMRTLFLT